MQFFALGAKCGGLIASWLEASSALSIAPSAAIPRPLAAEVKKFRRINSMQSWDGLMLIIRE